MTEPTDRTLSRRSEPDDDPPTDWRKGSIFDPDGSVTMSSATAVVAAFPATGKTYLASRNGHRFWDSDSSRFSWSEPGVRHPEWPENYLAHIREGIEHQIDTLVSTHAEVREVLHEAGIPFTLVYPSEDQRDDYIARLNGRGSPPRLVTLIAGHWDEWIASCRQQEGCEHIVLAPGQYLSDVIA